VGLHQLTDLRALPPQGTPDELRAHGLDVREVASYCVTLLSGDGQVLIKGCPVAARCSRFFGKKSAIGGFGPPSDIPGTPGTGGRENVPYSIEADGMYKEDFIPCDAFMSGLYQRMLASRDPENPTGEKIRVLGKAGEARIEIVEVTSEDPINCNRNGNSRIKQTTKVITVPKMKRLGERAVDGTMPRQASRQIEAEADAEALIQEAIGQSRAEQEADFVEPDIQQPGDRMPPEGGDEPAGTVEAGPVKVKKRS